MSANPFDQIIAADKEKKQTKESTKTKEGIETKSGDKITLTIDKRAIERAIYLMIIITLTAMVFFNPFNTCMPSLGNLSGATTADSTEESEVVILSDSDTQTESITETQDATQEQEETNTTEDETNEQETPLRPFSQSVTLLIENINYEEDEDGDPSKIKSITFSMKNNWQEFKPLLKVFWYDDSANEIMKSKVRTTKSYMTIKKGETHRYTIYDFDSTFFYPGQDSEIIKMVLYNANNTNLNKIATKTID